MNYDLSNKKIAVLMADGFEEVEFTAPVDALRDAGAGIDVISPESGRVRAWNETEWGADYAVDVPLTKARADEYHALLLPGGVMNPDKLRMNEAAVELVKAFFEDGKPVAAICHAPQLLVETGALTGRELTSYPSIKTDLKNAGARWVDNEVVVDAGLTTSRSPEDMEAFCDKMLEEFSEGVHEDQMTV
ncbi:type 1 glutamine amidotransferase domain-containing protein [Marinoscillum furvescens]|uniref:Protease I n=1 Tax=Marinoscillum furvescens DSM 4134 TaxID=1122208 RepID=A0A3D9L0C2_MARFU|nr:type 1 glutamine amidotransferase domain-containing protein [Marinoscillum furvescens]RED93222.1 protease I [Marinoscillum furvescens DSM 4134]